MFSWSEVFGQAYRVSRSAGLLLGLGIIGGRSTAAEQELPNDAPVEMGADCAHAGGGVQPLATIVNTHDRNYHCLGVSIDAGSNVTAVLFESHDMESGS